ncbi:MAG: enoyl-CoA hydratase/isomerase family protein [Gammaproteobacteria bacterium]|nr:enoyl-CoA hydratase/isomerase family protein [Gammaproteobacteria bacterium]
MDTLAELKQRLDNIAENPPRGLIILSDKPGGFIAGADLKSFSRLTDPLQVEGYIYQTQAIFQQLEDLACSTLALIHGFCVGGGLEMALACDYRIGIEGEDTRLGFPEIRLGIFPGFDGTVRSLEQVGPVKAMELMLSGRSLYPQAALKLKLLDRTIPRRQAMEAARQQVLQPPSAKRIPLAWGLINSLPLRFLAASLLKKGT